MQNLNLSFDHVAVANEQAAHQVGCCAACCGVTSHISSRDQPRKGPPDAVRTSLPSSTSSPARRHCAMQRGLASLTLDAFQAQGLPQG